ncbi:MAG: RES domain-containing protein [Kordiimonadaceae bacterium]|nr:RES domain-containing protein [Kordiimonadaceae bacterium]
METRKKYICADCFGNNPLKKIIKESASSCKCDYCGANAEAYIAADIDSVCASIYATVNHYYEDANVFYSSGYEGYVQEPENTDAVLYNLGLKLPNDETEEVLNYVINFLEDRSSEIWCSTHEFYGNPVDDLTHSWDSFCKIVKTRKRFYFHGGEENSEPWLQTSPQELFEDIKNWFSKFNLFTTIATSDRFFRIRYFEGDKIPTQPSELGPPPSRYATQANRMSPPGISMFYGSHSVETAKRETVAGAGSFIIGEWAVLKEIEVLDLTVLPEKLEIFDPNYEDAIAIAFLHAFVDELRKPINRDKSTAHLDYIPTQVITEFIRYYVKSPAGNQIMGIKYLSAADNSTDASSLVLFACNLDVFDENDTNLKLKREFQDMEGDPWLELVGYEQFDITDEEYTHWSQV